MRINYPICEYLEHKLQCIGPNSGKSTWACRAKVRLAGRQGGGCAKGAEGPSFNPKGTGEMKVTVDKAYSSGEGLSVKVSIHGEKRDWVVSRWVHVDFESLAPEDFRMVQATIRRLELERDEVEEALF